MAKITKIVKLQIQAGKATPAPPIGTALGPTGINIGQFCQQFNEETKNVIGTIVPVILNIYEDRTFNFELKTSPASDMLRRITGIEKGSDNALKNKVAKVTRKQIKEIAEKKMEDLNANDIKAAEKIIEGTARSMGIEIE